jgi:serine/threonine-protein kinase
MEQSKTGTAEKGSTIRIIISVGKATIEVPSVVGMDQASAQNTLSNAGFSVSVTNQNSDSPAGTVLAQSVPGSISADADRSVTITVSLGPASSGEDYGQGDESQG